MNQQQHAVAKEFDAYSDSYSDAVNDALGGLGMNVDFFTRVKADYIQDSIKQHFDGSTALALLDVGCGVGNFHTQLMDKFANLTGVDVSEKSIECARLRNPSVKYDVYNGFRLPYDDNSFDVAYTVCVMHHVPPEQWPNFMAEMYRVIKPFGLVLVFEHNARNPLTMRVVNRCPFDADAVLLRPREVSELMTRSGFKAPKTQYILNIPAANRTLRSLDRAISFLTIGAQYFVRAHKKST